jgi:hypothetical protein
MTPDLVNLSYPTTMLQSPAWLVVIWCYSP